MCGQPQRRPTGAGLWQGKHQLPTSACYAVPFRMCQWHTLSHLHLHFFAPLMLRFGHSTHRFFSRCCAMCDRTFFAFPSASFLGVTTNTGDRPAVASSSYCYPGWVCVVLCNQSRKARSTEVVGCGLHITCLPGRRAHAMPKLQSVLPRLRSYHFLLLVIAIIVLYAIRHSDRSGCN